MDIGKIVKNNGYVDLITNVLIQPYQTKILSHFKQMSDDKTKLAMDL